MNKILLQIKSPPWVFSAKNVWNHWSTFDRTDCCNTGEEVHLQTFPVWTLASKTCISTSEEGRWKDYVTARKPVCANVQCESFSFKVWPARKREELFPCRLPQLAKSKRKLIIWGLMSGRFGNVLTSAFSSCYFLLLPGGSFSQNETWPCPSRTAALSANLMRFCVQQQHVKKVESVWCRRFPRASCFLKPSRSLKQTGNLFVGGGGAKRGWVGGAGVLAKPNLMIQMTGGRT